MHSIKQQKREVFCLNKSKRHQRDWKIIEDLALEWNTTPTDAVFRSIREFSELRRRTHSR
jgi:hypothetical protein